MEDMIQVKAKLRKSPPNGEGRKFRIALVLFAASVASLTSAGATPPTVTGTLHAGDALRNWALTRSGNTWSVARTGLMLIFR